MNPAQGITLTPIKSIVYAPALLTLCSRIVGGAIGVWRTSYTLTPSLSVAFFRFPLAKLPAAVMGAVSGS